MRQNSYVPNSDDQLGKEGELSRWFGVSSKDIDMSHGQAGDCDASISMTVCIVAVLPALGFVAPV